MKVRDFFEKHGRHKALLPPHYRILIACILLCAVFGAFVFLFFQSRAYAAALTQQELRQYAQLEVVEIDIFIEQTRYFMSVLARLPQITGSNAAECNALMANLLGTGSRYANAGVVTAKGDLWCSGIPVTQKINSSDKEYFKLVTAANGFAIGEFQIGQVSKLPSITFGYPVDDASGKLQKIVSLSVNLSWLQDFAKSAQLPMDSTLILTDNQGNTLARYPGADMPGHPALETSVSIDQIVHIEQGLGEIETRINGVPYYIIAAPIRRPSEEGYLHLLITIPKSDVSAAVGNAFSAAVARALGH